MTQAEISHYRNWRHGLCYAMAIALHEHTGWPIHGLMALKPNSPRARNWVYHAYVVAPDGQAYDGLGAYDPAKDLADMSRMAKYRDRVPAFWQIGDTAAFRTVLREDRREWMYKDDGSPALILIEAKNELAGIRTPHHIFNQVRTLGEIHAGWLVRAASPKPEMMMSA